MPRPKILTPERRRELIVYVSAGMRVEHAARYVGCSVRTVRREADRNDQFRIELATAEIGVRSDPEMLMKRAAGSHWRAAAWMLERRDPHRFGRRRTDACGPQELEEICNTIIEVALAAVGDGQARRELYLQLVGALREVTTNLFPPPLPARTPLSFHPFTEEQRLFDLADEQTAQLHRAYGDLFDRDPIRPAESNAAAPSAQPAETPTTRPQPSAQTQTSPTAPPAPAQRSIPAENDPLAWRRGRQITLTEFLDRQRDHPPATFGSGLFCPPDQDNSKRLRREPKPPKSPRAERNGAPHATDEAA